MAHPSFSGKRVILHRGQLFCTHICRRGLLLGLAMFGVKWGKIYTKKSAALQFLFNCSLLFFYFHVFVVVVVTQTRYKRYHALPRKKSWNKIISFKKLPRIWWKRRMQSRYLYIHVNIGWILNFTITERILERSKVHLKMN